MWREEELGKIEDKILTLNFSIFSNILLFVLFSVLKVFLFLVNTSKCLDMASSAAFKDKQILQC